MTKRSFIPKSLRPDVPGTVNDDIIKHDEITEFINNIDMQCIVSDHSYRRTIIAKILSKDIKKFNIDYALYREVLGLMFPNVEKKLKESIDVI